MTIVSQPQHTLNGTLARASAAPVPSNHWNRVPFCGKNVPVDHAVEEMAKWLSYFCTGEGVLELRALDVSPQTYGRARGTHSGFYDQDHLEDCAMEALSITNEAKGVFYTLNPLHRDLLSRKYNRADSSSGDLGCDADVLRRRWLLVDADPVRKAGISSTDGEKAKAQEAVTRVREYLTQCGWADPIVADSGNGYHLLYRIDLPCDDDGLVKRALTALSLRFDTKEVTIDKAVFNPARIVKLYGTKARKGDDTPDRPHRWTQILEIPDEVEVVPSTLIETLAGEASTVISATPSSAAS